MSLGLVVGSATVLTEPLSPRTRQAIGMTTSRLILNQLRASGWITPSDCLSTHTVKVFRNSITARERPNESFGDCWQMSNLLESNFPDQVP